MGVRGPEDSRRSAGRATRVVPMSGGMVRRQKVLVTRPYGLFRQHGDTFAELGKRAEPIRQSQARGHAAVVRHDPDGMLPQRIQPLKLQSFDIGPGPLFPVRELLQRAVRLAESR